MELSSTSNVLILARHGESEGNRRGIFTGWRDLPLTEKGRAEARDVAARIAEARIVFDSAFSSALLRAKESAEIVLRTLGQPVTVRSSAALNERDYGELTGLDKVAAAAEFGAKQVRLWRRSFDLKPPGGESLHDTANRVLPFFQSQMQPLLQRGKKLLVVAHGNSLRALIMHLERLSPEAIETIELRTGELRVYTLTVAGDYISMDASAG